MVGPITWAPWGGEDTGSLNSAIIYRFLQLSCPKRHPVPRLSAHGVFSWRPKTDWWLDLF